MVRSIFAFIVTVVMGISLSDFARADYASASRWFQTQDFQSRLLIQFAIIFTDDYNALADGVFGRRTFDALTRFQKRNGLYPSGVLSPSEMSLLLAEAAAKYGAVGFSFENDYRTGLQLGVPTSLLPARHDTRRGTRWANYDGSAELETSSIPRPASGINPIGAHNNGRNARSPRRRDGSSPDDPRW
jgi:hypothetical protein